MDLDKFFGKFIPHPQIILNIIFMINSVQDLTSII